MGQNVLCFNRHQLMMHKKDIDDIYNQFLALNKENLPSQMTALINVA